ncbi:MAG TPA: sugar transferase [Blastocatellia bacterium]|nr:sugar transferase [Blastocatellia bacterium]
MNGTSGIYRWAVKRVLDIVFCVLALPVVLPLLVIIALIVRIHFGSSVLFTQERLGFHGRPFVIRKFRTMTDARADDGQLLPDAERLTGIGRFLRATSLDELPELMNVLIGEMSLVGPRPLYSHYRDRYTPNQFRRHEVLPGITGWAQVNGRNALSWEQKFALDVWYVDHQSFWLDMKIIALTTMNLIRREGINQPGHATAQEFKGSVRKGA